VKIQSNFEFQSLTSSPTRSLAPPQLQIHVHDVYDTVFGCSTYARKEDETNVPMPPVPDPTKIGVQLNCRNNFNIQSPTRPGAVFIKTDAQVTYDIQSVFWSYLPQTNSDSCVFVLSGNITKLSTTFLFTSFSEKIGFVVITVIDPNLFSN
jgi:hypothetical protein